MIFICRTIRQVALHKKMRTNAENFGVKKGFTLCIGANDGLHMPDVTALSVITKMEERCDAAVFTQGCSDLFVHPRRLG
jgi:hypothetical protein